MSEPTAMWRFRGSPHYLDQQGARMGVPKLLTDRARHNPEIYQISQLTGQLCERYHRAPKEEGRAVVLPGELAQVRATLGRCEDELAKLHVLAAAARMIVDEAHRAFGLDPPVRSFTAERGDEGRDRSGPSRPAPAHESSAPLAAEAVPAAPSLGPAAHASSKPPKRR